MSQRRAYDTSENYQESRIAADHGKLKAALIGVVAFNNGRFSFYPQKDAPEDRVWEVEAVLAAEHKCGIGTLLAVLPELVSELGTFVNHNEYETWNHLMFDALDRHLEWLRQTSSPDHGRSTSETEEATGWR